MRITIPPLIVKEGDSFKNDALDREVYGVALLNLILRTNDELVISIDGKWGEGKTTFVKMWQGLLTKDGVPNIYIDAFSNDYTDDAFISVASAITDYANKHIEEDKHEELAAFKEKTIKIGGQLLSWSARIGIKAVTLGVIKDSDLEGLKDIKDDVAKSTSDLVGDFIEEKINSHSKDIELIQSYRDLLSSIPSKIKDNDKKLLPLVIIIDELDRCKPTFSVEIIEKIKHLFSVKNVVFILVMNKSQLEESIKSVYGQNIDAHIYLQKFITLEATIPKKMGERCENDLSKYSNRLLQLHELETWEKDRDIIECIKPLANHFNLSLRQLEKVFTNIAVLYSSSTKNDLKIVPIIVFLCVIKVIDSQLFELLLHQQASFSKVSETLNLENLNDENENNKKLYWIMQWVRFSLLNEQEFNDLPPEDGIKNFDQNLVEHHIRREELIPIFSQELNMFVVT